MEMARPPVCMSVFIPDQHTAGLGHVAFKSSRIRSDMVRIMALQDAMVNICVSNLDYWLTTLVTYE